MGENKPHEAKQYAKTSVGLILSLTVILNLVALIFRSHITAFFTSDQNVRYYVETTFPLIALSNFFDALQGVLFRIILGIGKQQYASIAVLISHWIVRAPLGYLLTFTFGLGIYGLWLTYTFSFIACVAGYLWVISYNTACVVFYRK